MQTTQWRFVPGQTLADVVDGSLVVSGPERDRPAVEALGAVTRPRVDRGEVVELRDRARGRRGIPRGPFRRAVEREAVQDVRRDLEHVAVGTVEELAAKVGKPRGIVELVAVDAEYPGLRPRVALDQPV